MEVEYKLSTNSTIDCCSNISISSSTATLTSSGDETRPTDNTCCANWPALILLLLSAAGVTGNTLVCCAIVVERKLRNVTNYFLVSLAVTDLLVSLVVMPSCVAHDVIGYWPFGLALCALWQIADVTCCTSSIMHMCTISLDRYAALRQPLVARCRRGASLNRVWARVGVVWALSFGIASPLIVVSFRQPTDLLSADRQCFIGYAPFLVYGSLTAFFCPLGVMLVTYALTARLLRRRAAQADRRSRDGTLRRTTSQRRHRCHSNSRLTVRYSPVVSQQRSDQERVTTDDVSDCVNSHSQSDDVSTSAAAQRAEVATHLAPVHQRHDGHEEDQGRTVVALATLANNRLVAQDGDSTDGRRDARRTVRRTLSLRRRLLAVDLAASDTDSDAPSARRASTSGGDTESLNSYQTSLTRHDGAVFQLARVLALPSSLTCSGTVHRPPPHPPVCDSCNTPIVVRTERKAVRVVGMMFVAFVACWASFFVVNFTMGVCQSCHVDERLFKSFLWLGYTSSIVNPIIYTIFNRAFKRTFVRIVTCNISSGRS